MNKKKNGGIILSIILILGLAVFMKGRQLIEQDKHLKVVSHQQEWVLPAQVIKDIQVNGLDQMVKIEVLRGEQAETRVTFEGELPLDLQKKMLEIKAESARLDLDLQQKGLSINMAGKANQLKGTLRISLGRQATIATIQQSCNFADCQVVLPKNLAVNVYPKAKHGQVHTIKNDAKATTSIKASSEMGDVSIIKR